jgi:pimeloyl-ACP methyl ester carboxylesterase
MDRFREHRTGLDDAAKGLGLFDAEDEMKGVEPAPVWRMRRRGSVRVDDNIEMMTLVEADGVLRWEQGPSKIGKALADLDKKLNKTSGLRSYTEQKYTPLSRAPSGGRHLLIIHGTFSKSEAVIDNIRKTDVGNVFLQKALKHYDRILTFDHPTVSVSPILNALDLDRAFAKSKAKVDIICHSRGGLVTRWWLELLNDTPKRCDKAILVGSPLGGTSLAAPPALRSALDMFTNIWSVLEKTGSLASSVMPLLTVVTGIMRVLSTATKLVAKTPIIDAAVAMIPGLVAQSRTSDNAELQRLRSGATPAVSLPSYYAVKSDFEPSSPGWEFWKHFTDSPKQRLMDRLADPVFKGANDLVVDTASMTELGKGAGIRTNRVEDFGQNDRVHHLNYFEQPETLKFFHDTLSVPK